MDRRLKVLWVKPHVLMDLMGMWRKAHQVGLPHLERCADADGRLFAIPPDYEITDCCFDWHRNAFGFRLRHHSFEEVPEGMECPSLYYREITITVYKVVSPADPVAQPDAPLVVEPV